MFTTIIACLALAGLIYLTHKLLRARDDLEARFAKEKVAATAQVNSYLEIFTMKLSQAQSLAAAKEAALRKAIDSLAADVQAGVHQELEAASAELKQTIDDGLDAQVATLMPALQAELERLVAQAMAPRP